MFCKHVGIVPVDPEAILDRVARLPIAEWSYDDDPTVRHVGPMAQDFHAAFGVGASDNDDSTRLASFRERADDDGRKASCG